jgi:hypothetical protein
LKQEYTLCSFPFNQQAAELPIMQRFFLQGELVEYAPGKNFSPITTNAQKITSKDASDKDYNRRFFRNCTCQIKAKPKRQPQVDLDNPQFLSIGRRKLLEFQRRVLEEAEDENNLLLERLKFLSIVGSNSMNFSWSGLSLRKQIEAGFHNPSFDGLTPNETLAIIRKMTIQIMTQQRDCWRDRCFRNLLSWDHGSQLCSA